LTSSAEGSGPIILFDGVCNLCTASVQFVLARDSHKRFRFASLQSPAARKLLGEAAGLWPLLAILLLIPAALRDAVYDWIGRRRYRMFGKRDVCWKLHPELAARFLD
jgi:predicted DCC family thiol-disulfide oxidoreductase YuxK